MNMKRLYSFLAIIAIAGILFTACTPESNSSEMASTVESTVSTTESTVAAEETSSSLLSSGMVAATSSTPSATQSNNATTISQSHSSSITSAPNLTAKTAKEVQTKVENERKALGISAETMAKSLVSSGNQARIAAVMRKAMKGEPITIGVIGGSVTYGSCASDLSKTAYAPLVAQWWQDTFPQSKVSFVNAGLGATDSVIGVHRVQTDLLNKKPDFIIIEFSVNDYANDLCAETYENLVRRCLKAEGQPGVLLLHMVDQAGNSAQSIHQPTGEYYQLPIISYRDAMQPLLDSGKIKWSDLSPDSVHPNDHGHAIAALFVKNYLSSLYANLDNVKTDIPAIPKPRISDAYENARLLTSANFEATKLGSFKIDNNAFPQFKNGWTVTSGTEAIEFKLKDVKNVLVLYYRNTSLKSGKVKTTVNFKDSGTIDAYYSGLDYATYHQASSTVKSGTQLLTITPVPEGDKSEFKILGIMVS